MSKYPNSGVLFQNDRKDAPNKPDRTGTVDLDRDVVKYLAEQLAQGLPAKLDISAWDKTSSKGTSFISLSFRAPRQKAASAPKKSANVDPDDDLPF